MQIKKEYTFNRNKIHLIALLVSIPVLALTVAPYMIYHKDSLSMVDEYFSRAKESYHGFYKVFYCSLPFLVLIISIFVHEFLHGICFAFSGKNRFNSVKFGIDLKSFAFYAHCKDSITKKQAVIASLMPAIVLGFFPLLYAYLFSNPWWWLFGLVSTVGGVGDFIYCYHLITKTKSGDVIMDHPEKMGFMVVAGD
ncbi:MAG: DUF3267 domain-containing protein [Candidatus Azobacteroides sp.]|nr:DUF3267 domain-containing protein [Candidatus Azobacteroides sp.]